MVSSLSAPTFGDSVQVHRGTDQGSRVWYLELRSTLREIKKLKINCHARRTAHATCHMLDHHLVLCGLLKQNQQRNQHQ